MFERGIGRDDVKEVVAGGEAIAEYPDDSPYPSRLMLGHANGQPIHVVVAVDTATATCIVITVYEPQSDRWKHDFRTRRAE
jgi:hypothetical protein